MHDFTKKIWLFCLQEIENERAKIETKKNGRPFVFKNKHWIWSFFYLQSSNSFLLNLIFQGGVDRDLKFIIYFDLVFMWWLESKKNVLWFGWCSILWERIWIYCLRKIENKGTKIEQKKKQEANLKKKMCQHLLGYLSFEILSKITFYRFSFLIKWFGPELYFSCILVFEFETKKSHYKYDREIKLSNGYFLAMKLIVLSVYELDLTKKVSFRSFFPLSYQKR